MKKLFILVVASAAVACGLFLPTASDTPVASAADRNEVRFTFAVQSRDGETGHRINLEGTGAFDGRHVEGGGTFTWFNPVGPPPFPVIAAGSWRARKFLGFAPTDPPVYGVHGAGILQMEVELRPIGGRRLPGVMRVVCNIGAGGMVTGEEEGVALALRDGTEFEQVTGLTFFIPGR